MSLQSSPTKPTRRGLTLLELLVVAVVLAICAAVIVPQLAGANEMEVLAAARLLAADLQYAQNEAITRQEPITVTFDTAADSYWVSNTSGTLIHPMTKKAFVVQFASQPGFKRVEIDTADFAGSPVVTFDAMGTPDQGGVVELRSGSLCYRIRVAATTGNVTVSRVGS